MIEEVNQLINDLNISGEHAEEIINIYFECYAETWTYINFLRDEVRVIPKKDTNKIEHLLEEDDICLHEGDDYFLITNYDTFLRMNHMEDLL